MRDHTHINGLNQIDVFVNARNHMQNINSIPTVIFSNQLHIYLHLGMSNHTHLKRLKKYLLLLILYHMQKTNYITQLILKIKLTNYLSSLWACSGMTDHTHLKQPTNIHGPLATSKNSTSSYL